MTYRVLSLFAGIGGFDLGLERTGGFKTVAFCEFDKKAQAVLRKHWPEVPIYDDVRTLTGQRLAADGIAADVICGGFPCQDISTAGAGAGIAEGTRSGLWFEFARLIGELRPRYVLVENVSALLGRGLDTVLGYLASLGYDVWWDCIPACAVGAPHRRDRIWLVAYSRYMRGTRPEAGEHRATRCDALQQEDGAEGAAAFVERGEAMANAFSERQSRPWSHGLACNSTPCRDGQAIDAVHGGIGSIWAVEPPVGRVADGVPGRVDRLKQLGNAVVPQIPELIGRAILASEAA